ncbi:MAG: VOC family protein [Candidatus Heimdallarchaeota archaeon]|nr:MAG: VOC family protein [Candidatus Heimdallarchaeota archaeon]
MSINLHHIGIVVHNLKPAVSKYCKAFGLNVKSIKIHRQYYITGKGEEEEFDYAFLPLSNNCFIELVEPVTEGPTKRYLEKKGEGLFHIAFESEDIEQTISDYQKAGIPLAGKTPTEELLSVFFHPKSTHGVLIQLMKKDLLLPDGSPNFDVVSQT